MTPVQSPPVQLPPVQRPPEQRPIYALGLRLLAALLLQTMMMLVKLAGQRGISLPETMFWRQAIPAVLIVAWLGTRGQMSRLRTTRIGAHATRSVMGLTGMFLTLGVVQLLPLSEATVLGFTAPIFATLLSVVLLRERVGWIRLTAVALGFAGVLVIAGPEMTGTQFAEPGRTAMPLFGLLVGIGGAFMIALISIQLRELGRTERPLTVVFWFSAFSAVALGLALPWTARAHDMTGWAMLAGIGVTGLFGQLALTAALRYGSVASVIVMDYSTFAWATLWGWLVFAQLPPASTWVGAPLVVAAGLVIVWREHRLAVQKPVQTVS